MKETPEDLDAKIRGERRKGKGEGGRRTISVERKSEHLRIPLSVIQKRKRPWHVVDQETNVSHGAGGRKNTPNQGGCLHQKERGRRRLASVSKSRRRGRMVCQVKK